MAENPPPNPPPKRSKCGIPSWVEPFTGGGGFALLVSVPIALIGCLINPLVVVVEERLEKRKAARWAAGKTSVQKKDAKQNAEIYQAMEEAKEKKEAIKEQGCGEDCPGRKSEGRCLMHGTVPENQNEKPADAAA